MKSVNEINQKIEELRKEYREIDNKFPFIEEDQNSFLINELLSGIAQQIRILQWVIEEK
jgi:hypothetical protein